MNPHFAFYQGSLCVQREAKTTVKLKKKPPEQGKEELLVVSTQSGGHQVVCENNSGYNSLRLIAQQKLSDRLRDWQPACILLIRGWLAPIRVSRFPVFTLYSVLGGWER